MIAGVGALPAELRKELSTAVLAARRAAEAAARASLAALGVFADRRPEHLDAERAALRVGLRAKWRQLSEDRDLLVAECAYEQWHRLLFARFLAENDLLLHPEYETPVTLDDCAELAAELGEPDAWSVASRFAAEILPGIFRLDDPCVRLRFAPEGRHALERVLDSLPREVFRADDALGWVYQFWQTDRKDEINRSERKIGGADLGPVTQLFTENYMVRFLLENSLGAWWAAHHPDSPLVKGFEYLRFDDSGVPAAGTFDGWPDRVAEVTVMDPCCGSGHFLVEAFSMLWQMRAEEERLSPVEAQDAVLRDNLFGLELDLRCVQIAMFAVVSQAWRISGWRRLPTPKIVCSGISLRASAEQWKSLAGDDPALEDALLRFHDLFREANALGSLIHPGSAGPELLESSGFALETALAKASSLERDAAPLAILGAAAQATVTVGQLLLRRYWLVATNPPFLGWVRQGPVIRGHLARHHTEARHDLATAFLHRFQRLVEESGTMAVVMPHGWMVQPIFEDLRHFFLHRQSLVLAALLGEEGFAALGSRGPRVDLLVINNSTPKSSLLSAVSDASTPPGRSQVLVPAKLKCLKESALGRILQKSHLARPGKRIIFAEGLPGVTLKSFARSYQGIKTGDDARFRRYVWEARRWDSCWRLAQGSPAHPGSSGLHYVVGWGENGDGIARAQGLAAWGRMGIAVSRTRSLSINDYYGHPFFSEIVAIVPSRTHFLPAIRNFARSGRLEASARSIDPATILSNGIFGDVAFDWSYWATLSPAEEGLENCASPLDWRFTGLPHKSVQALQVAIGRLLGYRWPEQPEDDDLDQFADADGIACLPAVAREAPAVDRLQNLLAAAFGASWSQGKLTQLIEQTGSRKTLDGWLRDEFFRQHCALFGHRPFVWHVWDGRKDGFSALVNYHMLDRAKLEKLTYTYLGQDWMERVRVEVREERPGAEARLAAAVELQRKLELILAGEAPYDIYVRWKELHEQPMGWEPDLNDGVRLNIRPFVIAEVLRTKPNIKWGKDRGRNPDGSERVNDLHKALAEKRTARRQWGAP